VRTYLFLKGIHILGVILLLGNIIVTAWWKIMADRTRDPRVIAFAQRQVTLTDWVFTAPGALITVVAGDTMAYGFMSSTWKIRWLVWGRLLFIASGIVWATVLIPIQIRQAQIARSLTTTECIPDEYWRLTRRWQFFGAVAVALPLLNIYWMVFNWSCEEAITETKVASPSEVQMTRLQRSPPPSREDEHFVGLRGLQRLWQYRHAPETDPARK